MFKIFTNKLKRISGTPLMLKLIVGPIIGLIVAILTYLVIAFIIYLLFGETKPTSVEIFFPRP